MTATGLFGNYALNNATIDAVVKGIGPGAYALGGDTGGRVLNVRYVGRSDNDLSGRLKQWVGQGYTHFQYAFFPTSKDAFDKECQLYHEFGGSLRLDNKVHPARPQGSSWTCPVLGCRG
jgi:hypothetical protein